MPSDVVISEPRLLDDLRELSLSPVKIIFSNSRKGRWTLEVRRAGGELAVLKWNQPDLAVEGRTSLRREIAVYEDWRTLELVEPLATGPHFLLLAHLPGKTLREALLSYRASLGGADGVRPEFERLVESLARRLEIFFQPDGNYQPSASELAGALFSLWNKLLLSGPMHTQRRPAELRIAGWVSRLAGPLVRRELAKSVQAALSPGTTLRSSWMHGDLHYNNILVADGESGVRLIDLENATRPGCWLVDLSYLRAMCTVVFTGYPEHQRLIEERLPGSLLEDAPQRRLYSVVGDVLSSAVRLNARFSGVESSRSLAVDALGTSLGPVARFITRR